MPAADAGATVTLPESNDFKKGSSTNPGYAYNVNGNLTKDLNKKITGISYNLLHLPERLTIDDVTHSYTYAADGRKLKVTQGGMTRDYAGSIIYENGSLKRILFEGGYIEGGEYYFYEYDHLGNVQVVVDFMGVLVQYNHYYPFNGNKIYNSTEGSIGGGPKDNKGELSWSSPQEFLDDYNQATSNEDLENEKVNGYGYKEGYVIPTTVEQDHLIEKTFLEAIDQGYSLINNQCSMAVQKALNAAKIKTQIDYNYSPVGAPAMYSSRAQYNPYLPSVAYRSIVANNPNGVYVKKR